MTACRVCPGGTEKEYLCLLLSFHKVWNSKVWVSFPFGTFFYQDTGWGDGIAREFVAGGAYFNSRGFFRASRRGRKGGRRKQKKGEEQSTAFQQLAEHG